MKVLHAIDVLQPAGGTQSYVRRLAELQAEVGHDVGLVHRDDVTTSPEGAQTWRAVNADWSRSVIREFDPDVIHVHDWGLPEEVEREFDHEIPLVRSLHNFSFACASGTRYFRDGSFCTRAHGPGCLLATITHGCAHRRDPRPVIDAYRRIESFLPRVRTTPRTVLHSEYMQSVAVLNGVPSERCTVLPYFVEFHHAASPIGDERVICFSGRIVRNKGLDLLLRALARILDAWDRLVIVGDGWDVSNCRDLARRLGLAEKVEFRGWVDARGVRRAISDSRLLAMPSRWPEPFGIIGLEAMALARPVAASRGGGVTEWLDEGETGLLFEPGDIDGLAQALSRLLSDRLLAERLGDEGRRRVARFSPEAHLAALERIYADPVASPVIPRVEIAT